MICAIRAGVGMIVAWTSAGTNKECKLQENRFSKSALLAISISETSPPPIFTVYISETRAMQFLTCHTISAGPALAHFRVNNEDERGEGVDCADRLHHWSWTV